MLSPVDPAPGTCVAERYRLRRIIGRGGISVVFEAEHVFTGAVVALKMLNCDRIGEIPAQTRLTWEARTLGAILSPGVARIHDAGISREHGPYLAVELVDGRSLESFLAARRCLSVGATVAILSQVAATLDEVHAAGIVHRDIKPANLMIVPGRAGAPDTLRLIDFGIASVDERGSAQPGLVGTMEYMAPEQLGEGPVDRRADVYALGIVAYECLAGGLPFPGTGMEALKRRISGQPPRELVRDDVPPQLVEAIGRALTVAPDGRFPSAGAFAAACRTALAKEVGPLALFETQGVVRETADDITTRRRHARSPYRAPIRMLSAGREPTDGRSEDISEGGMLVLSAMPCADGDHVTVRFPLPTSGRVVALRAIARWIRGTSQPLSIGLQFEDVPDDATSDIRGYVALMNRRRVDA